MIYLLGQGKNPKWCVRYPDGSVSQPMNKRIAKGYAEIWGGKVERVPKEEEE